MLELRDIDLNLLVVFDALYRLRRVSATADVLGMSQPTVSNALGRLRRTVADPLFVRTAHGMVPTPFAEGLAVPVADALDRLRNAMNHTEAFDAHATTREFTLALSDVGEVYFLPVLAELCARLAPSLRLSSVRAGTLDIARELAAGRIDLAIGAFAPPSESIFQRRLFEQRYATMFRRGHALGQGPVTLSKFLAARHLLVASPSNPYNEINQLLEKAGVSATSTVRVPHFVAVPYIVSNSELVVTVPHKLAERAAAPFALEFVRPPLDLPILQTKMFWHRRFHLDPGNQWLRARIAERFAETASPGGAAGPLGVD